MEITILWQDETALAVVKPAGMLVHNSRYAGPKEVSLRQRLNILAGQPVYPLHRLDRPTSGVVLFVRQREMVRIWQEQLAHHSTTKVYLALVRGYLQEEIAIDHPIRGKGVRRKAFSLVRPLARSPLERCSLVEVRPTTGRKHQIRRHLAHISHHLIGDTAYGKGAINRHYRAQYDLWRLALHAWQLNLRHPLHDTELHFQAPVPEDLARVWRALFPEEPHLPGLGEEAVP